MDDPDLTLAEQSGRWVAAIASAIKALLPKDEVAFSVQAEDADSMSIQKDIRVGSDGRDGPSLNITAEESQAFLSIDRVPGASIPRRASGSLSEVDLVRHVIAFTRSGYAFVRFPLFERLRIPGFDSTPDLEWGNIDLGWPPVMFSRWKPSPMRD